MLNGFKSGLDNFLEVCQSVTIIHEGWQVQLWPVKPSLLNTTPEGGGGLLGRAAASAQPVWLLVGVGLATV